MGTYSMGTGIPSYNGIPMVGGFPTGLTKVFFVDYGSGSDGNKGTNSKRPLKTIAKAYSLVTTNKNEGIALMGNSTHVLTAMLTVAKSRVHIFGFDPGGRKYGQNAKIGIGVTTAVTDIAAITNTGIRNSFRNVKIMSDNTLTEGIYTVVEAGEYTVYDGCEIYLSTQLTVTAAGEMVMNGDSCQMYNCTIGSLANAQTGTVVRPCMTFNNNLAPSGSSQARECYFENVRMLKHSAHTTSAFVYATADADIERTMEFKDCAFINAILSAATPAVAVVGVAALTVGQIVLSGNTYEIGCDALATQTGIWSALPTLAAAGGSALQAT